MDYLSIQCIQGNSQKMSGRLIVYAIVKDLNIPESLKRTVHNNILAIEGDYLNQKNIRDFFRKEFDLSLEEGIEKMIGKVDRESASIDPKEVKSRVKSVRSVEILPIPAKVIEFNSVEEIKLKKDYDIYYLGEFESVQYAHLSVNSFPIIYQARYREQESQEFNQEIEIMLGDVSKRHETFATEENLSQQVPPVSSKEYLLKELIPNVIYNIEDLKELEKAEEKLQIFLKDYPFPEDIQKLQELIETAGKQENKDFTAIELIVDKIWALQAEDYKTLKNIKMRLQDLGL